MEPAQIVEESALEAALAAPRFLLFKHSHRCGISTRAFRTYEIFCESHTDVPTGWLDVVAQRDWSLRVAERTGVGHQSPQAIWIRRGAVAWHASHTRITREALEALETPA